MTIFEIRNKADKGRLLGYLFYYERSRRFFAELLKETDEWSAPFMFSGLVKRGVYSIDSVWSRKFVEQRIVPFDRQNLGEILRDNDLKQYDEYRLLQLSEGRCAQDELYLKRINMGEVVPEISERLNGKVLDVMALSGFKALVFFKDGAGRIADVGALCKEDSRFGYVLRDEAVFKSVRVSPGGNGIEWGEERFIPSVRLKKSGKAAAVCYDDVVGFVRKRLCDSAEISAELGCTRQYVKQLTDKKRLIPVREGANSNIYMKNVIERNESTLYKTLPSA